MFACVISREMRTPHSPFRIPHLLACVVLFLCVSARADTVVLVTGASGGEEYAKQFATWAERWESAASKWGAKCVRIGGDDDEKTSDHDRLRDRLQAEAKEMKERLWLVLIGHGTFDGKHAKFNLRGPDVSTTELAEWCAAIERPLAVIDCTSSSGPFLNALSARGRVIITATRSGHEQNFARFGDEISLAIGDPSADLDKDGQTSLLEAYLRASRRVEEAYASAARLATEHALLDDNGDGQGTPATWFQGIRATKQAKDGAALDGPLAHCWHLVAGDQERQLSSAERERRDQLEQAIAALRAKKKDLSADDYYGQLEKLLIDLAQLYGD
jgi:hypothetical protein